MARSDNPKHNSHPSRGSGYFVARVVAFCLVIIGMMHNIPGIPGLDQAVKATFGEGIYYRRFPTEYLFPLLLTMMMVIVACHHSWATKAQRDGRRVAAIRFGRVIDVLLVCAGIAVSLAYLTEIHSVCMIDQITGKRVELIEKALAAERELAVIMGLPEPTSVGSGMF